MGEGVQGPAGPERLQTQPAEGMGRGLRKARAAELRPRRGARIGFRPHLKSLSLDVIFSSKLEMW